MSDIFREVDEEFRRSQAEAMWRRYSGVIFAICVVIVLAVAGWRFYDWQRAQSAAAAGAQFEEALRLVQTGKKEEGDAALARIAAGNSSIYAAVAKFRLAADQARANPPEALKAFDALAADTTLDAGLRDVARLRGGAVAVDILPFAEAERRLSSLAAPGNIWRHNANELLASAALKAGQLDRARQYFDAIIIDREAPQGIKARAELLIGLTRGTQ